jgi:hypothetical protein
LGCIFANPFFAIYDLVGGLDRLNLIKNHVVQVPVYCIVGYGSFKETRLSCWRDYCTSSTECTGVKSFTGEVLSLNVKCTIGKSTAHISDETK